MKLRLVNTQLAILFIVFALLSTSCRKEKESDTQTPQRILVQTATATLQEQPVIHQFSGNLEAEKQSNLSTRLMGQVARIYVTPGEEVTKGQLLLQIRNQDIIAKKAQIEANKEEAITAFKNAEKDYNRYEALYASKSVSDKEMDDMRANYQMAKARLAAVEQMEKEVQENMRYASIRAPYSGVITGKYINEGDMANPGMPLLSIENPKQWKVITRVPESDIAKINLDDNVEIYFQSAKITLNGQVVEITPSTGQGGNQYQVKVLIQTSENNLSKLYSGMYANVLFEYGSEKKMLIPQKALIQKGQLTGLYAMGQSGNVLLRWVRTGKKYGEDIEIISGLAAGEKYVISANSKLYNGALVASNQ